MADGEIGGPLSLLSVQALQARLQGAADRDDWEEMRLCRVEMARRLRDYQAQEEILSPEPDHHKRPRKPRDERLTKQVLLKISEPDLAILKRRAGEAGVSLSRYIRDCALAHRYRPQ